MAGGTHMVTLHVVVTLEHDELGDVADDKIRSKMGNMLQIGSI